MIIRAMALGLAQKPDLIVLTGDFWTDRHEAFGRETAGVWRQRSHGKDL